MSRAFEDLEVGETWHPGSVTVSEEEIVEFARQYDPQPFHLPADDDRVDPGDHDRFGGPIASGWHTAAACMRPFAERVLPEIAIVAAAGVDDLRWHEPVHPGDSLDVEVEIVDKDAWNEDRGLVTFRVSGTDADGRLVHSRDDLVVVDRR